MIYVIHRGHICMLTSSLCSTSFHGKYASMRIFLHPLIAVVHNQTNIWLPDHTDILKDTFSTNTLPTNMNWIQIQHIHVSCVFRCTHTRTQTDTENYSIRNLTSRMMPSTQLFSYLFASETDSPHRAPAALSWRPLEAFKHSWQSET